MKDSTFSKRDAVTVSSASGSVLGRLRQAKRPSIGTLLSKLTWPLLDRILLERKERTRRQGSEGNMDTGNTTALPPTANKSDVHHSHPRFLDGVASICGEEEQLRKYSKWNRVTNRLVEVRLNR